MATKSTNVETLFHVFDCVPLADWQVQKSHIHYRARLLDLQMIIGDTTGTPFRYVKSTMANDEKELRHFYEECLNEGYEGVMLKDLKAPYQWKRSSAILKLKPVATEEGVIVGWYEASKTTKRAGQFGGFKILTPNGSITRVGGGYSDKMKAEVNNNPDSYIGMIAECEHQPPFTPDGKLRFPVFCRFRDASDVDPKILAAYDSWKGE